jgi:hypothetical protein
VWFLTLSGVKCSAEALVTGRPSKSRPGTKPQTGRVAGIVTFNPYGVGAHNNLAAINIQPLRGWRKQRHCSYKRLTATGWRQRK